MDKRERSKRLLRALTDVDDRFLSEAMEDAAANTRRRPGTVIQFKTILRTAVAAAACLVIAFAGKSLLPSSPVQEDPENVMVVSPLEEVGSIEEAEAIVGFGFTVPPVTHPDSSMSVAVYSGNMIEVVYSAPDRAGYVLRKAAGTEDISGDYTDYAETASETVNGAAVTLKGDGETWSLATWTKAGYTYVIGAQSAPMTREAMCALAAQIE